MNNKLNNKLIDYLVAEIISDILASEVFKPITKIKEEEIWDSLTYVIARFATYRLRPFGIPLIMIKCGKNGKYYHIAKTYIATAIENIYINSLDELSNDINQLPRYNDYKELIWFYKEADSVEKGEFQLNNNIRIQFKYLFKKNNSDLSKDKIADLLMKIYENMYAIIKEYNTLSIKITADETTDVSQADWLFNIFCDHVLMTAISVLQLMYGNERKQENSEKLIDGFILQMLKMDNEYKIKYLPRLWQKDILNIIKNYAFNTLNENPYPCKSYQSGYAIATGISQVSNPLVMDLVGNEYYPENLLEIEKEIWDTNKFKVFYLPINQGIMNRFLIAVRIPKDREILETIFLILEKYASKIAVQFKMLYATTVLPTDQKREKELKYLLYEEQELPKTFEYDAVRSSSYYENYYKHNEARLKKIISNAASAILLESYAHNIGAHGLEELKNHIFKQWQIVKTNVLNEVNTESLLRIRTEVLNNMVTFDRTIKEIVKTHSNFPEYLWYLQGKSAFWSAIARGGELFGGNIISVWKLIDDFAKNNLLCGSLGSSEGYKGIKFFIHYDGKCYELGDSTIEDDYRFRFEEESLLAPTFSDLKTKYKERTKINIEENKIIIRNLLEKIEVFLPEGIVGQQAVYTIWENIIRNVKHCKKNGDLIPFHIEIIDDGEKEWIEIANWIDLDSEKPEELENAVNKMNDWKGVIDEFGKPIMGGTSQNILCAGMVFAQDYLDTEKFQKEGNTKLMKFELIEIEKDSEKVKRIRYTFKIWKAKKVGKLEDILQKKKEFSYQESLGRYKII